LPGLRAEEVDSVCPRSAAAAERALVAPKLPWRRQTRGRSGAS